MSLLFFLLMNNVTAFVWQMYENYLKVYLFSSDFLLKGPYFTDLTNFMQRFCTFFGYYS